MSSIKILPENIVNKIAAGEVVQRPESVVKELMENAIDSGAKNIDVFIKNAGKSLIQVCDDGTGMTEEDAVLSVQKHATSKISNFDDLNSLGTLGFRGEALSSIVAVSQLEVKTQTEDEDLGTWIKVSDKGEITSEKGSFVKGTSVIVKNLFYNVPARIKFLKTNQTEFRHISDTFKKIALGHWGISFKLYNDKDVIFDFRSGDLEKRIGQIFADNMSDALIKVEENTDIFSVTGYIGKPAMLKSCKGDQYIFINNRYVINRQINHAVFTAYESVLKKGDYPFFVLFLDIEPDKIDVNIHPSKMEVKFDDEKSIYNLLLAIIRKNLGVQNLVYNESEAEAVVDYESALEGKSGLKNIFNSNFVINRQNTSNKTNYSDEELDRLFGNIQDDALNKTQPVVIDHPFSQPVQKEYLHRVNNIEDEENETGRSSFIFQLHDKYILSQIKSGLIVIDQNAAHRRILFEKAFRQLKTGLPFSQQLLFPRKLELDREKFDLLKEILTPVINLGFSIAFLRGTNIEIRGVPEDVKHRKEDKILLDILNKLSELKKDDEKSIEENLAKVYSEAAAIKENTSLNEKEMRSLIDHLFSSSKPYICPNGRPTLIKISLTEFSRRFGNTN